MGTSGEQRDRVCVGEWTGERGKGQTSSGLVGGVMVEGSGGE